MDSNSILSIVALIVSIGGTVISIFNHKRLRSHCCSEKEIVVSLDIENTTPPNQEDKTQKNLKIDIPKESDKK